MILEYLYTSKSPVVAIYDGESVLNGERILALAYLKESGNDKVKRSFYVTYLPYSADTNHHQSVCGNCRLKPFCFTRGYMQFANYKWVQKYKEGMIPLITVDQLEDFRLKPSVFRFGMHGDPASIPFEITEGYIKYWQEKKVPIIGYTHQAEEKNYNRKYNLFLSSIESLEQKRRIKNKTARVIAKIEDKAPDEVICPYDYEKATKGYTTITCGECRLCSIEKDINIAFLPKKPSNNFINFLESQNAQQDSRVPSLQS